MRDGTTSRASPCSTLHTAGASRPPAFAAGASVAPEESNALANTASSSRAVANTASSSNHSKVEVGPGSARQAQVRGGSRVG